MPPGGDAPAPAPSASPKQPAEPTSGVGGRRAVERPPRRRRAARCRRPPPRRSCCRPARLRAAAMLAALVLFPVLILGDQWHSQPDRRPARRHRAASSPSALAAAIAIAALRRALPPLAAPAAAGDRRRAPLPRPAACRRRHGNLLVPLYLVIAGGVLATALDGTGGRRTAGRCGRLGASARTQASRRSAQDPPAVLVWLPRILAAVVVLYALQTLYSADFSKGLQNVCFFFVPFSARLRAAARRRVGPAAADRWSSG